MAKLAGAVEDRCGLGLALSQRQIHRTFLAMATRFDCWLVGADDEHLDAVAQSVREEVERLEQRLSCFDKTSEISRLNRASVGELLRVDPEVFAILADCERWRQKTLGAFDICHRNKTGDWRRPGFELDATRRTFCWLQTGAKLDLGGYAKGYALGQAKERIQGLGVSAGLLSAGTSSVVAFGVDACGKPWTVKVADPFGGPENNADQLFSFGALSLSVHLSPEAGDTFDPRTGTTVPTASAVAVETRSPADAEALSTALLVLGVSAGKDFLRQNRANLPKNLRVTRFAPNTQPVELTP